MRNHYSALSTHHLSSLLVICWCCCLSLLSGNPNASGAAATDSLVSGQSLRDGETLVSAGEVFELGFFSPGRSKNRYVGIWYHNFSANTVVWVANRNAPLADSSGELSFSPDGNLVVLTGAGTVVWSSNISVSAALPSNESSAVQLQLQSSGNLVLNISGATAWQSFDHPTDTYLPGMKIGLDLRTNVNQLFTSWKSEDDPAVGDFSVGIDPNRSTQIFLWEGTKPRWRSGRWNGQVFIGIQNMVPTYIYGFRLSNFLQEQKMYFYFTAFNSSHRYVLTADGIEQHLIWAADTKSWFRYFAEPVTACEHYNTCGKYATCTDQNSPICACMRGYVPAVESEWNGGSWTDGCVRRVPFLCDRNKTSVNGTAAEADGFWKMEQVKLPDLSDWYSDIVDADGCRRTCLSNCSCKAYAYTSGIGCLIWGVDLVDVHIFSSGGNELYLRLAGSELDQKKTTGKLFLIPVVLSAIVILSGCVYLCWRFRGRIKELPKKRSINRGARSVESSRGTEVITAELPGVIKIIDEEKDGECRELPLLSFDSIVAATNNFSYMNLLGEGGFGPVYKGMLAGGQEVAVKRLSSSSGQGPEEFKNEVILIAKLQHRNLVRLLGCCIDKEEKILIYEYMPNRSLDSFLFDARKKGFLDWKTRYNIIEGIARGLLYLHRDSRLRVIHRDLKVSNILLDEEMNPKISDFGMARIFRRDDNESNTKRVAGTYGYMSPEYAMQGLFSVKSDVYSFGVILLEIVSGMKNSTYLHPELSLNLLGHAWKLWNEDNVLEFVDPSIRDSCSLREVSRCINAGLLCVQDRANDRPTMSSVVIMLESKTPASYFPRQPTFAAERNLVDDTDSSTNEPGAVSANASITMLVGR
ncbi:G-type lectin S-receptor-like serine/threonine-protein kinase B120 isoform X1 [Ananas comosus]|uniref:Receptor-like serine/threonine-protein kinase n=1 Tax=Ananas comosus TaxID=4615 RepID=A0A6P5G478_ANACO|nr:G-type lectin S-receptor-like serine/threonine-protein kinase B120 isoform X1 [Ananas comosus]